MVADFGYSGTLVSTFPQRCLCLWLLCSHLFLSASEGSSGCLLFLIQAGPRRTTICQKICMSSLEMTILVPVLCHYAHRHCHVARKALKSCDPLSEYTFYICCLNLFTPIHACPGFSTVCWALRQSNFRSLLLAPSLISYCFWHLPDHDI